MPRQFFENDLVQRHFEAWMTYKITEYIAAIILAAKESMVL